jgi:HD-GYP domain-containing protein (c-di-GMP phosphodiesterase class II)
MKFNLNELLMAVSKALDYVEMDILGVATGHSGRVAYLAVKMARALKFKDPQIFDLASLALLHDNGISEYHLHNMIQYQNQNSRITLESTKEHCIIGEENMKVFASFRGPKSIILYHHENYDGTGFFGLKGEEIPLCAQIIGLADNLDFTYKLNKTDDGRRQKIMGYIHRNTGKLFSPVTTKAFLNASMAKTSTSSVAPSNTSFFSFIAFKQVVDGHISSVCIYLIKQTFI